MSVRGSRGYRELYARLLAVRNRLPWLQPLLRRINLLVRVRPPVRFRGWGMTTEHALPWDDAHDGEVFRRARADVRRFGFTGEAGIDTASLDPLDWRHWIVTWAARYAVTFTDAGEFVECGVADGTTAYYALSVVAAEDGPPGARRFHLYDAWTAMRAEQLSDSEQIQAGRYARLSQAVTRRNLERFADALVWHVGHLPASLTADPPAPARVAYVHCDLNASAPTVAACEFFWQRLVPGGIMLFDDYGWLGFEDTKEAVDAFFAGRPGLMVKFPTGQAAFLRR